MRNKLFMFSVLLCYSFLATKAQKNSSKKILAVVYTTAKGTDQRLTPNGHLQFGAAKQPPETQPFIFLDPSHSFQTFIGIGGALTDAAAETFAKLPVTQRQALLRSYYDPKDGIGYTFARTNMNSCDFSSDSYAYVKENDKELKSFDISHDLRYKIPFIKQAMSASAGKLLLFASPWSPPAWMKDNNDMLHGGKLKADCYQSWANYYVKFIKAYQAQGVNIWGLTVQNEPMAKQKWESCIYGAEEEKDFIKNFLGPALQKNGLGEKKLIAWDHNRDQAFQRASVILNDPAAAKYVWGVGYHWYETWTGGPMQFDNIKLVAQTFPGKNLVFTEGCNGDFQKDSLLNWSLGERYGMSMINDFNSGTVAWTDWNVLLDEQGGPNHVGNFCFAPIHADTKANELIYTNAYYYIGHFSKFIQRDAKRISASSSRSQLLCTAFRNPDGSIVAIVMNPTEKKISWQMFLNGQVAEAESLPNSISTFVIR